MIPQTKIVRSSKRKRTVALRVENDGTLTVHAPVRTSLGWIQTFIREKAGWISGRQRVIAARNATPPLSFTEGMKVPFMGKELCLTLREMDQQEAAIDSLHIPIPGELSEDARQAEIKTGLILWYKKQARRELQDRLNRWATHIGVTPTRLFITNTKGRWGSCTARNEIRLSWRLVLAPAEVVDYVLVHELCHIPHKNHGKRFWGMVDRFIPDAKRMRQQLRNIEKSVFLSALS